MIKRGMRPHLFPTTIWAETTFSLEKEGDDEEEEGEEEEALVVASILKVVKPY